MPAKIKQTLFCRHWRQKVIIGGFVVTCSSEMYPQLGKTAEPRPDFGVYLDSRWKAKVAGRYPAVIANWPDFKAPKAESLANLVEFCLYKMRQGKVIDIGCLAGHGRTGTLLASLIARVEHLDGATALRESRRRYCSQACETRDQQESVISYARRCGQMKRTISQLVYDLLDREGLLPATEIAKRLGITRGTACSARDRWKNKPGSQPSAKSGAPAEVKFCDCIVALEEKGYVRKDSAYEDHDFVDKGYSIRHLYKDSNFFALNYCPACGGKLMERGGE